LTRIGSGRSARRKGAPVGEASDAAGAESASAGAAGVGEAFAASGSAVGETAWLIEGGRIRVSVSARAELPKAAEILDEASAWLEGRGLVGWPRPFPIEFLEAGLAKGDTYLAQAGATALGTFTLYRSDATFWGERPHEPPDHARYLHRLAVRRGHRGLGRALVDLAEIIARAAGAACLRLDCAAGNPGLRRYYEELGFEHRGDLDVPGLNWRASLYEKPLR
jgi:GNAT superfamily N-acetyltransferase